MTFLDPEGRQQLKLAARVSAVGIEFALSVVVGYFGGRWIDGKLGTIWLSWVGLALGIFAGFRSLYRLALKTQKDLETPPDND
jgi:hypothetical protein